MHKFDSTEICARKGRAEEMEKAYISGGVPTRAKVSFISLAFQRKAIVFGACILKE